LIHPNKNAILLVLDACWVQNGCFCI